MASDNEKDIVESSDLGEKGHPFDRLMFGSPPRNTPSHDDKYQEDSGASSQINIEELMIQIDTLMDSAKQLKPMFHKIRPFIDQFLKK